MFHQSQLIRQALVLFAAFLLAPALHAIESSRVALVIGNADYKDSPLKNPGNDAEAIADKLKKADALSADGSDRKKPQTG